MEEEIWKDVIGYEGLYRVSNLGRVKSLYKIIMYKNNTLHPVKEKYMKIYIDTKGYPIVDLSKNGIRKHIGIHTLIARAFIPNPKNRTEINHKDLNKLNFNISNLEWSTRKENIRHAWENGAMEKLLKSDKKNYLGNKKVSIYNNNKLILEFESIKKACEYFNRGKGFIYKMIQRNNGQIKSLGYTIKLGLSIKDINKKSRTS